MFNCVVVTIKTWNTDNFRRLQKKDKYHRWFLIEKKDDLDEDYLEKLKPRYIFFSHWSWIIPKEIWSKYECVVFHMTDLPYGRGGTPLQNLIVRGYKKTKVSAIRVDEGLDTGDVYLKRSLSLSGSANEIYRRVSKIIFFDMIPFILKNKPTPIKQSGRVVRFRRRKPRESRIPRGANLQRMYDYIRMLDAEDYPRAFLETSRLRLEFGRAKMKNGKITARTEIYEKK